MLVGEVIAPVWPVAGIASHLSPALNRLSTISHSHHASYDRTGPGKLADLIQAIEPPAFTSPI